MALDWSALSDWKYALSWGLRKAPDADVYEKNNVFTAIALTDGYALTDREAAALDKSLQDARAYGMVGSVDAPERYVKSYFIGRILGEYSPHSFLPDPCKLEVADDPNCVARVIGLHTIFVITSDIYAGDHMPVEVGDLFNVLLHPGTDGTPFDLQIGVGLSKLLKGTKRVTRKAIYNCESIEQIFDESEEHTASTGVTGESGETSGDLAYTACETMGVEREWTATAISDLASMLKDKGVSDKTGTTILAIAINEQGGRHTGQLGSDGVGGPNHQYYGMMADLGSGATFHGSSDPYDLEQYIQCAVLAQEGAAGMGAVRLDENGEPILDRYFVGFANDSDALDYMIGVTRDMKGFASTSAEEFVHDYWHMWGGFSPGAARSCSTIDETTGQLHQNCENHTDKVNNYGAHPTNSWNAAEQYWRGTGT